jgi:formate hydrogenlyase subunit 3/multisubunit Na+/H+ antiporter MnhD subunit
MPAELSLILAIITMGIGAIGLWALNDSGPSLIVRRWSEMTALVALSLGLAFSIQVLAFDAHFTTPWLQGERLQAVLVTYILIMGVVVKRFAYQYIQSDSHYPSFFLKIKALIFSLLLFVVANHAALLFFAWSLSGWMLCQLIKHTNTRAGINSATNTWQTFLIGDGCLLIGLCLIGYELSSPLLSTWVQTPLSATTPLLIVGISFMVVGALSKTANAPFTTWLPQTLTAPTPVSAIMHAGFVNSGAILFAKLAPLLIQHPTIMSSILIIGLVSALWGSLTMMVQPDVKRYLTFSTIGQMGFMMIECGLGAFHLAIGHLIVHGLFKSRLFLSSGNVVNQRQAIRNVSYQIKQGNTANSWQLLIVIPLLTTLVIGILSTQQEAFSHLLTLPPLLITTIILSLLFSQLALLRSKNINVISVFIAMGFSLALLAGYVAYDMTASNLFPSLEAYAINNNPLHWWITLVTAMLGGLTFLAASNIAPLSKKLKTWGYITLLNASGYSKNHSAFTHR